MKKKMNSKELCKELKNLKDRFSEINPDSKEEALAIKFGVSVMTDAIKAIKQGEKAIELLKEFAFYNIDQAVEEHCEQAVRVQEFLKTTPAREWLEEQLRLAKCEVCDEYNECQCHDGTCED